MSCNQLLLERVICKTFTYHRCNVIITDRIRSLFANKLSRMGKAMYKLGGRGRATQIETWKGTTWTIDMKENEIVPNSKKRKAENVLVHNQVKRIAQMKADLEAYQKLLKDANAQLTKAEETTARITSPRVVKHNKSWSEYTAQYKRKQKKQIANKVSTALKFTDNTFFQPVRIDLVNKETDELLSVDKHGSIIHPQKQLSLLENKDSVIEQTLYVKERFNVSDKAYHELSMVNPSLPCWSALHKVSKQIDSKCHIYTIPGPILGIQQSLKERLQLRLQQLVKKNPGIKDDTCIRVKITGDGTQVSRSMHILVIAFTIIDGTENPNSPVGNHVIALLNAQEKYEYLSEALKGIASDIKSIKSLTINGQNFNIKFYLCADMKYLAICAGIQAANAKFSCVWCKCPAEQRHNTSKSWCTIEEGTRTIDEIKRLALVKNKDSKYGCIHQPLFPSVPINHIIPDILHLFLRISDTLINLLILDLRRMDGIEKFRSQEFKSTTAKNVNRYITYLNVNCKISFHMYVDQVSKNLKWRDLTGPEKLRLFKAIKIVELFPELKNADKIQELWNDFKSIYDTLWSDKIMSEMEIKDFTKRATAWITLFTSMYQTKNVTPYMHVLVAHLPKLMKDHGNIRMFSQQGLEKLNDDITKDYFKSTNHKSGEDSLRQILFKLNRLEYLTDQECIRTKHSHVCSKCKEVGHNSRTCPADNT